MTDVPALEQRGFNAWPAPRHVDFGGWVFRLGGGYTKRANSANAVAPAREFPEVRLAAERFYFANGQPTIFRLTPLAGPDADPLLAAAGYESIDPSLVMTAPLDAARAEPAVRIDTAPTPAWLNGVADAQATAPPHRRVHEQIVRGIAPPAAFATIHVGETATGFALGVCERGVVGLFDIVVRENFRGVGLGRALTRALMAWGRDGGAHGAYLQVSEANPARRLYESLGFAEAYAYHYRRRAFT